MKTALFNRFTPALLILQDALATPEDFQSLSMTFQNGSQVLTGSAVAADDAATAFRYRLPGHSGTDGAAGLMELIRDCCRLYDACRIELFQRGQNRFFAADERGGVRLGNCPLSEKPAQETHAGQPAAEHDDGIQSGVSATRDYKIRINEAPDLLKAIGIIDGQGRLRNDKIRKYNQIDRFVELAEPVLRDLANGRESLTVCDLACGKSYLSFVLNYYIREKMQIPCQIIGIDRAPGVIESSRQLAARLAYRNMSFEQGDLRTFKPAGPIDLCISLHACDTATDYALAAAVAAHSRSIIVVPCCQRELLAADYQVPESWAGLLRHGVLKARLADLLTDNLRLLLLKAAGYETSLIEYVSPLDTPKNLMIRARRTGSRDGRALSEYRSLTAQLGCTIALGRIMEETDYGRYPGDGQS
jgi:hypothetical protein